MNPLWLLIIVPLAFCLGFFLAAILASARISEIQDAIIQKEMFDKVERREML
jgi:hypothetical protein